MKAAMAAFGRLGQLLCLSLALVVMLPALPGLPSFAQAQQAGERQGGTGILRFLFQRPAERQRQDRAVPRERVQQPARRAAPSTTRRAQPGAGAVAVPEKPVVEKAENAKRILVVGDFLAGGLADGLTVAFGENANALVVDRSNGSSGLVRDDYYDWPGQIGSVIDAENPTVVVVMLGSNDRQQMRVQDNREQPRSQVWTAEYERRITTLVKAIRDRQLPLIWIGNLPFKAGSMSSDMVAFNDIYRRIVTDNGGEYVDIWDGFVDETGTFVASGPDVNGQPAQLRASDGINVTRQGRRKMAFYAEKPLNRILGTPDDPANLARLPGQIQGPMPGGADLPEIDRTVPIGIDDYQLDGGPDLLGASIAPRRGEAKTPSERLIREGIAPDAEPGRADDFSRRPSPTAATDPGRTTSVTR
jgi:hypothetical protein